MEVHLSAEQQAQLAELASRAGKQTEQLALEAVDQMLESEARFAEGVQTGFASLDRGEYVEHEEVGARIERLLQS
jgi:predicted transcriptional regulator